MNVSQGIVVEDLTKTYRSGQVRALDGVSLRVTPGDASAVAEALSRLIGEPELARRLGEAGRERIESEFSIEEMVRRTIEVYESVIGAASGGTDPRREARQES